MSELFFITILPIDSEDGRDLYLAECAGWQVLDSNAAPGRLGDEMPGIDFIECPEIRDLR